MHIGEVYDAITDVLRQFPNNFRLSNVADRHFARNGHFSQSFFVRAILPENPTDILGHCAQLKKFAVWTGKVIPVLVICKIFAFELDGYVILMFFSISIPPASSCASSAVMRPFGEMVVKP
ncbi:MAG: hypothetical protein LBN97_05855 [Oscillospiraceae bacterium]|jgi:hypothetical protein|nr:hypothetical protein [Oscillospiraceae bacterium]